MLCISIGMWICLSITIALNIIPNEYNLYVHMANSIMTLVFMAITPLWSHNSIMTWYLWQLKNWMLRECSLADLLRVFFLWNLCVWWISSMFHVILLHNVIILLESGLINCEKFSIVLFAIYKSSLRIGFILAIFIFNFLLHMLWGFS
jgi:hypothetical protein